MISHLLEYDNFILSKTRNESKRLETSQDQPKPVETTKKKKNSKTSQDDPKY